MDTIAPVTKPTEAAPAAKRIAAARGTTTVQEWPIGHFVPSPLNPRKTFDPAALEGLGGSIGRDGILQPLLARPRQGVATGTAGSLEIIAGERRYRATRIAIDKGLVTKDFKLPVIVHACTDAELLLIAGTENLQRDDLHPLEWAQYFEKLKNAGIDYKRAATELNIPHRTVTRRVRLLRCIPEVQKAFRDGKITGQQAEAFADGDAAAQRKLVKIGAIRHAPHFEASRIREEFTQDMMPLDTAFFDRKAYTGDVVETPDGDEFFADRVQAAKLQQAALDAKLAELRRKWPWAEIVKGYRYNIEAQYPRAGEKDAEAGAIIIVDDGDKPVVREGVLSPTVADRRRKAREAAGRAEKTKGAGSDRLLTADQVIAVKRAKTQALRRAVHDHPKVGLVLAIMGLASGQEIDVHATPARQAQFSYEATPPDAARHEERASVALGSRRVTLSADGDRFDDRIGYSGEAKLAQAFAALLALPDARLLQILGALMAELVGARCHGAGWSPADSPFEIALAKATVAEHYLDAYWAPTADFFRPFNRTRLAALGHYPGVGAPVDFDTWKKGKMVEFLAGKPKGFWKAALFPELRGFADEKTMRQRVKDQIADAKINRGRLIVQTRKAFAAATAKTPAKAKTATKAKPRAKAKPKAKAAKRGAK